MTVGVGRSAALGVVFVVFVLGLFAVVLAIFNRAFSSDVEVTVRADRAGLLMEPGSLVIVRGVEIGTVRDVTAVGPDVQLHLSLRRRAAAALPDNVSATLESTSPFGPKSVRLWPPAEPGPRHLDDGSVITATGADIEINQVYRNLASVLDTLDPVQLNATLTAMSTAVRGRGAQLGNLVDQLDRYLRGLNPALPDLRHDIEVGADVANSYAAATPDLLRVLDNLSVAATTVTDKAGPLHDGLGKLAGLGDATHDLLAHNGAALRDTLDVLAPTVGLLSRYSPEFPCLFQGIDENRKMLEKTVGGDHRSARLTLGFLPGAQPYRYPTDLPKVAARGGPECRSLPTVDTPAPYVPTDTGTNPQAGTSTPGPGNPPAGLAPLRSGVAGR